MKLFLTLFFCYLTFFGSHAQSKSDILVFSDNGKPFLLYINGLLQSNQPQSQYEIIGLPKGIYKATLIIDNDTLNKNLSFSVNSYTSFVLKEKKNGQFKLRFYDEKLKTLPIYNPPTIPQTTLNNWKNERCPNGPIDFNEFQHLLNQMEVLQFDEEKWQHGRQHLANACILSFQVLEFLSLFSDDYYRLEFVKQIAPNCIDQNNKHVLVQTFNTLEFKSKANEFLNTLP